jgi:hypothetical protein
MNPGLSLAATEPLICSSISRWGLMAKPAASISFADFLYSVPEWKPDSKQKLVT